jgi:antitoxin component YwqK of YwqJK toxin-antitoxin module
MALQVHGLSRWLALFALIGCLACQSGRNEKPAYYNADKISIHSKGGITYSNTIPITGIVFSLNANGDTSFSIPYRNGKEHGFSRHYHDNGQMKSLRCSENGWKEGEHTGWFENGQKQFVYHFTNDMFDGNQKEWLSNGTLYSDLNYVKGSENGSQRIWYTNGKIKTNYIIKNNRRYGLLGTKNCVNNSDSVFVKL